MRKLTRLCIRLFLLMTFFTLIYLSKNVYEIDDLPKHSAEDGFPRHKLNEDALDKINHHEKWIIDMNRGKDSDNKGERIQGNRITEKEEERHKATINSKNGGEIDVKNAALQNEEQHNKGDDRKTEKKHEPIQFPPFVSWSPDDGPGEHGKPVKLQLTADQKRESDRLFVLNDFNQYVSDRISVHRRLDNTGLPGCRSLRYPSALPKVSVIICFHNEAWSVLLRSVHSILDRSPPELLGEIILVDDYSTMDHLKEPLERYFQDNDKLKIVRASQREGLIRGRLLGYNVAQYPVLVFLDSHIECFHGWLEPLLARISENSKAVVYPCIPSINKHTFAASTMPSHSVGYFKWDGLTFTWDPISSKEVQRRTRNTDPIRSPTMPGGLFAINKDWFTKLGTYDPGLDYWGGENIELSFKAWMCNGTVEKIPCSQVAHIYRQTNPIKWPKDGVTMRNSMRVAEVWMDAYKEVFYDFSYPKKDFGDVSERIKLRESLHCHNFEWYLDEVLSKPRPPVLKAAGEIRSKIVHYCLDSMGDQMNPGLFPCHGTGMNQRWVFTENNELMQGPRKKLCYENSVLQFNRCSTPARQWYLHYNNYTIQHAESGLCLEIKIPRSLSMTKCNGGLHQRWNLPEMKT